MTNEKIIMKYLSGKTGYYKPNNSNLFIEKTLDGEYVGLYSYETLLAFKKADEDKVYIADTSFSSVSARHASLLRNIASTQNINQLLIPMLAHVSQPPKPTDVVKRFEARMDKYRQGTELALKVTRDKFLNNYERYVTYMSEMQVTSKYQDLYTELADNLKNNAEFLEDLKKQRKEFFDKADELYSDTVRQHY